MRRPLHPADTATCIQLGCVRGTRRRMKAALLCGLATRDSNGSDHDSWSAHFVPALARAAVLRPAGAEVSRVAFICARMVIMVDVCE